MSRSRFNWQLLDDEEPFEIDEGNRFHLYKHLPTDDTGRMVTVGADVLLDMYIYGDPAFYEAKEGGAADWLMLGQVPGLVLCVPLAPPDSGLPTKCRPIGIYTPARDDRHRHLKGE